MLRKFLGEAKLTIELISSIDFMVMKTPPSLDSLPHPLARLASWGSGPLDKHWPAQSALLFRVADGAASARRQGVGELIQIEILCD